MSLCEFHWKDLCPSVAESDTVLWVECAGSIKHGYGRRRRHLGKAARMLPASTAAASTERRGRGREKRQPGIAMLSPTNKIGHPTALFSIDNSLKAAGSSTGVHASTKEVTERSLVNSGTNMNEPQVCSSGIYFYNSARAARALCLGYVWCSKIRPSELYSKWEKS